MILPDYWLPLPSSPADENLHQAFEDLWQAQVAPGKNQFIQYTLPYPRWQFLCYLADEQGLVMHGSPEPDIAVFEPRQSNDLNEFGNQKAVYGANDGLWPMYFAILDRKKHPMSLANACIRLRDPDQKVTGPFYFFSISRGALAQQPWRTGTVYILPKETFVFQQPMHLGPVEVLIPQVASFAEVTPLAKLEVRPEDFPYLAQIRPHDDERLAEYSQALMTGAPWPD